VIRVWDHTTGKELRQIGETKEGDAADGAENILRAYLGSSVPNLSFCADGATVAAIHCHGPSYRFPGDAEAVAARVVGAARKLGAMLP